jgi:hypothetical protein
MFEKCKKIPTIKLKVSYCKYFVYNTKKKKNNIYMYI